MNVMASLAPHDHDHHNRAGSALTVAARATILAAGEQWTDMRAGVFAALAGFDHPASAYDIADAVSHAQGRRVAANSIYRILDLFVAANVALRIESRNAYLVNAHPECLHDCVFLVCDACGKASHVDDDALSDQLRATAAAAGFIVDRPVIEVRGRCAACANNR
jgi:Fur family transcriptional regulator, zinc uptake regulator